MTTTLKQNDVIVKKSTIHGYGVFAKKNIHAGDIIEECYSIPVAAHHDEFNHYCFTSNKDEHDKEGSVILLGYGCIYNHSDQNNASYSFDSQRRVMVFKAKSLIKEGEEIFISYGQNWFSSRSFIKKEIPFYQKLWSFLKGSFLRMLFIVGAYVLLLHLLRV